VLISVVYKKRKVEHKQKGRTCIEEIVIRMSYREDICDAQNGNKITPRKKDKENYS